MNNNFYKISVFTLFSFAVLFSASSVIAAINITAPGEGETLSGQTSLSAFASTTEASTTVSSVMFYYLSGTDPVLIAEQTSTSSPDNYSTVWDTSNISDGPYSLFSVNLDSVGNQSTSTSVMVNIRNAIDQSQPNPPTGFLVSPLAGITATTTIPISVQITDAGSGLANILFYLSDNNGTFLGETSQQDADGLYTINWNPETSGVLDGEHYLYTALLGTDGGASNPPWVLIKTDNNKPVASFTYDPSGPTNGNVTATLIPNRPVTILNNSGTTTYTFIDNGSFRFDFVDELGRTGSATATVSSIDRTAPVIPGLSPIGGSYVNASTSIVFQDADQTTPQCSLLGSIWGSCSATSFGSLTGFSTLPDGRFTLNIKAIDDVGNESTTSVDYIKDTITPTIVSAETQTSRSILLSLNEALLNDSIVSPQKSDLSVFSIRDGSRVDLPIDNIIYADKKITINLTYDIKAGDQINYLVRSESNLSDLAGNIFNAGATSTGIVVNKLPVPPISVSVVANSGGGGGSSGSYAARIIPAPVVLNVSSTTPFSGQVLGIETFYFSHDLMFPIKKADVRELQKRLMKEGFMATSTVTNYFGPITLNAVRRYQKIHNLPMTGNLGPKTRAVLNGGMTSSVYRQLQIDNLLKKIQNLQSELASLKLKTK